MTSHLARIAEQGNLREIWRAFHKAHRDTAAGLDGVTIEDFRKDIESNLRKLRSELLAGYSFSPLRALAFKKPNSKKYRIICVPRLKDRLAQRAISQFLCDDTTDRLGLKNGVSFAFLKGEGGVHAAQDLAKRRRATNPWAYKSDISSFFDTIDRGLLISKLRKKLRARSVLPAIERMIACEAIADNGFTKRKMDEANIVTGSGLRQGMPISPLLANLVLDEFDATLAQAGLCLIRYADDFIVFTKDEADCLRTHKIAREALGRVGHAIPDVGDGKTQIAKPEDPIDFLGLLITPTATGSYELLISDDQKAEIFHRLGAMTSLQHLQSEKINIANLLKKASDMRRGYLSAYANAEAANFQSFKDKLDAAVAELPEKVMRQIFPAEILGKLSPAERSFLCLD